MNRCNDESLACSRSPTPLYAERAPRAELAEHVRALFHFSASGPGGDANAGAVCCALFADAGTSIVIDAAGGWAAEGLWTPRSGQASGYVVGPMTRAAATSMGRVDAIGVYLRPGRGAELLGAPVDRLTDRVLALDNLWGAEGTRLGEAASAAMSIDARFALLEDALLGRLRARRRVAVDPAMARLATVVERAGGRCTVDALARLARVTRQQLTRRFRAAIGVPPKVYCRLSRFRGVLRERRASRLPWAELAATCGYADQCHLIADFRAFTGRTPASFAASGEFHPFS